MGSVPRSESSPHPNAPPPSSDTALSSPNWANSRMEGYRWLTGTGGRAAGHDGMLARNQWGVQNEGWGGQNLISRVGNSAQTTPEGSSRRPFRGRIRGPRGGARTGRIRPWGRGPVPGIVSRDGAVDPSPPGSLAGPLA